MRQEVENPIVRPIHEPIECGVDWRGRKVESGEQTFFDQENDEVVHFDDLEDYVMERLGFTVVTAK